MKWLKINETLMLIVLIVIFFVNLSLKAETEAERRASERRIQEILDRDEKKTQQETDRVYNERYGPGKTDYSYVPIYFILYPMVAFMIYLFLLWFIESWKEDYGWKRIEYTGFNLEYKNKKKLVLRTLKAMTRALGDRTLSIGKYSSKTEIDLMAQ